MEHTQVTNMRTKEEEGEISKERSKKREAEGVVRSRG
jgi:hypothetical protein